MSNKQLTKRRKTLPLYTMAVTLRDEPELMKLTNNARDKGLDIGELASLQFVTSSELKESKNTRGRMQNRGWRRIAGEPEQTFFWFKRGSGVVIVEMLMKRRPTNTTQTLNLFYSLQGLINQMLDDANDQMPEQMRRGRRPQTTVRASLVQRVAEMYWKLRMEKREAKLKDPSATPNINVRWEPIRAKYCPNISDEKWIDIRTKARGIIRNYASEENKIAREKFAKSAPI
jgi:hypothetical protein